MHPVLLTTYVLILNTVFCETFFLFKEKTEPILFCIKVCPLYCSPRTRRDADNPPTDYPPSAYMDEPDWKDWPDEEYNPYFVSHYNYCQPPPPPPPTTTTQKPSTTTEEPSYICQLCKVKCNYPPRK